MTTGDARCLSCHDPLTRLPRLRAPPSFYDQPMTISAALVAKSAWAFFLITFGVLLCLMLQHAWLTP